jgi:hypothetical protein
MKSNRDETSKGLNQIFEIINAKGDTGELKKIAEKPGTLRNPRKKDVQS